MATIHHFPHRLAAARPRGQGTPNPVPASRFEDAARQFPALYHVVDNRPDLYEQLRQRQRDEALDRATAVGIVGLAVMLLVALAIGFALAAGRV